MPQILIGGGSVPSATRRHTVALEQSNNLAISVSRRRGSKSCIALASLKVGDIDCDAVTPNVVLQKGKEGTLSPLIVWLGCQHVDSPRFEWR